jgi:hypothetical protein
MSNIERYYEYIENLLLLQYKASEIFEHNLQRGEIREDFVISQIMALHKNIDCCKGTVDGVQTTQKDLLIPRRGATQHPLGGQVYFSSQDIMFDIEIKSNATGNDFKEFNDKAGKLKALECGENILAGMFCYNYKLKRENLLERFGFVNIEADNPKVPKIKYPHIDFVVALDSSVTDSCERESFFIQKSHPDNEYIRNYETPVIKHFFNLLKRATI